MKIPQKIVAAAAALWLAGAAHAADLPTFKLEMTDGKLNPARIEVPAGQRFKIEIRNTGKGAAEFERAVAQGEGARAGRRLVRRRRPAVAGRIQVFDDFHQQAQGVIVAK